MFKAILSKIHQVCCYILCVLYKCSLYLIVFAILVKMAFLSFDQVQRSFHQMTAHKQFPICLLYKYNLSLTVFEILAKMKFWPLTFDSSQISFHHMKAHTWFSICAQYKWRLYFSSFVRYLSKKTYLTFQGESNFTHGSQPKFWFLPLTISYLCTKFHKIPSITSPNIVFTNKQTDRQTNQQTDKLENITSLTEIIK